MRDVDHDRFQDIVCAPPQIGGIGNRRSSDERARDFHPEVADVAIMMFDLHGYSERGMIWTLFGELARHENGGDILTKLLKQITPAIVDTDDELSVAPTVIVEQSFSDFGDADVLLLLDSQPKRSVLIEAKVCCGGTWSLGRELARFKKGAGSVKKAFSNLFCQLYAKQRLIETLRAGAVPAEGVDFLDGSNGASSARTGLSVEQSTACVHTLKTRGTSHWSLTLPAFTKLSANSNRSRETRVTDGPSSRGDRSNNSAANTRLSTR